MTTIYYLVGRASSKITGENLPTLRDVLKVLLFHHNIEKLNIHDSAVNTIKQVEVVWKKHNAQPKLTKNSIEKLKKEFNSWKAIRDNQHSDTHAQKNRRAEFVKRLDGLFDIAVTETSANKKRPQPIESQNMPGTPNTSQSLRRLRRRLLSPSYAEEDDEGAGKVF